MTALAALALALMLVGAAAAAGPPRRVVSVNLCTDQLALMLAAPGQLVSVSRLARDPASSAMAAAAQAVPVNDGRAEEVFLLRPDLVLAGTFSSPATVDMLRRLGIRVERFAPARSLEDIPALIGRMGRLLGREAQAERLIARFRADLAALRAAAPPAASAVSPAAASARTAAGIASGTAPGAASGARRPRAALYHANGYTLGSDTLAGDILAAAGLANVADEAGLRGGGRLPLERLILLAPEVIVRGRDYPGQARAEAPLNHPALRALRGSRIAGPTEDRDWICGTPQVLAAIRSLRAQAAAAATGGEPEG